MSDDTPKRSPGAGPSELGSGTHRGRHPAGAATARLDQALAAAIPGLSRRRARALIAEGRAFVDDKRVKKQSAIIPPGAALRVHVPEPDAPPVPPLDDDAVLWCTPTLVAANKPSGMPTEPTRQGASGTLAESLRVWLKSAGEQTAFLAGVHRLDVETTGVCVFARDKPTAASWGRAFQAGAIDRTYLALVHGVVDDDARVIDAPIARAEHGGRQVDPAGQPSTTHVRVLARGKTGTLLEVIPETGRTHQIRLHLAHIGHPLVGESRYADGQRDRLFGLHAFSIRGPGGAPRLSAPWPPRWRSVMCTLGVADDQDAAEALLSALTSTQETT